MNKLTENLRYVLGVPKTIYFNFKYFKPSVAIKLPVVVSHKTILREMKGSIKIDKVKTGIVRIGFGSKENFDFRYNRTIFRNRGEIRFKGKCKFGYGSVISNEGLLVFGENSNFAKVDFICRTEINIGDNCLSSWNILIMDTDHHQILKDGVEINAPKGIKIGNKVWIGANSTILKGVTIANNNIIASGSTIFKSIDQENAIIGSETKVVVLKDGVNWE